MQILVASAVVLSAVVLPSLAQGPSFMVNSPPSCSECTACLLSWQEQDPFPPFVLSILPAGQTAAPPSINPVTTNDSTITFLAPFMQNSEFTIQVSDAKGNRQFSSIIPVVSGASTSCVNNPDFNAFPSVPGYTVGNVASASSSSGSSSGSSSSSSGSSSGSSSSGSTSPTSTGPSTTGSPTSSSKNGTSSTTTSPSGSPTRSSATALTSSFFALFGVLVATLFA